MCVIIIWIWVTFVLARRNFQGLGVLDKMPHDLQAALLVHWFREGFRLFDRFYERWKKDKSVPPEFDKEDECLHNREKLLKAIQ